MRNILNSIRYYQRRFTDYKHHYKNKLNKHIEHLSSRLKYRKISRPYNVRTKDGKPLTNMSVVNISRPLPSSVIAKYTSNGKSYYKIGRYDILSHLAKSKVRYDRTKKHKNNVMDELNKKLKYNKNRFLFSKKKRTLKKIKY